MRTVVRMAFHLVAGAPDSAIILCTIMSVLLLIAPLDVWLYLYIQRHAFQQGYRLCVPYRLLLK